MRLRIFSVIIRLAILPFSILPVHFELHCMRPFIVNALIASSGVIFNFIQGIK